MTEVHHVFALSKDGIVQGLYMDDMHAYMTIKNLTVGQIQEIRTRLHKDYQHATEFQVGHVFDKDAKPPQYRISRHKLVIEG